MISVIIPTYNREKTIERAIESVIKQTYTDWELIIVDDCSVDRTVEIIKEYQKKDNRIRGIFLEKNAGACNARNVGIDAANGEYIAFQDSDDDWFENKLEKQLKYLLQNNADIVVCKMKKYSENGVERGIFPKYRYIPKDNMITYEMLLFQNLVSPQNILAKAECFRKVKFDKEQVAAQDWEWSLRAVKEYKMFFQNEVFTIQYFQNDSISVNYQKKLLSMDRIYKKNIDGYKKNNKIEANYWGQYAGLLTFSGNKKVAIETYRKSLKLNFTCNVFAKMLLTYLNLYKK